MRRIKVRFRKNRTPSINSDRLHKPKTLIDLRRELSIARRLRRLVYKVEIPRMQARYVGVTAGREGAEDVQRLGGLMVRGYHVLRIVATTFGGEFWKVCLCVCVCVCVFVFGCFFLHGNYERNDNTTARTRTNNNTG